jgi:hypothetical protein
MLIGAEITLVRAFAVYTAQPGEGEMVQQRHFIRINLITFINSSEKN